MRKGLIAGALAGALALGAYFSPASFPKNLPRQEHAAVETKKIPTVIYYDEEMKAYHGDGLEQVISTVVEKHNTRRKEWLNEELQVAETRYLPSKDSKRTGIYFLHNLILRSDVEKMNIYLMGQNTYFFNRGGSIQFGGLAQHRGNAAIIWGARPATEIAMTFDHEMHHTDGAYDIELPGMESTYTVSKGKYTPEIDIGNLQLIKTLPRTPEGTQESQRNFKARIDHASGFFSNSEDIAPYVESLMLEEHTVTSDEYQQALKDLLQHGQEKDPGQFVRWMTQFEQHPRPPKISENKQAGESYAAADAAYKRGDYMAALVHIGDAISAYKGNDRRITAVMNAAQDAILERLVAKPC